jgi:hypothetical protein
MVDAGDSLAVSGRGRYRLGMKRLVVFACLLGALWGSPAADASTPIPWCGTDVVAADRQPDLNPGFDVHVIYAHAPGTPDRFLEWAPRIAGDVAAIDAWWRTQDAGRTPRFDLSAFPCSSVFGAIDISRVSLAADPGPVNVAFENLRDTLSESFTVIEKAYLVYYDGNTRQPGLERTCGQGAEPGRTIPGFAIIFLDSCSAETKDTLRPVVAVHELVHVLGAVENGAPHLCSGGHVCDVTNDLLAATLLGSELEALVLDGGRDDYYGHSGSWLDVQDSLFLERLDSSDRTPPSTPVRLNARGPASGGSAVLSWAVSSDDVGPVSYRIMRDGRFAATVRTTTFAFPNVSGRVTRLSIRAVDSVGRLSPSAELFFKGGLGVVDARGKLIRDTVKPPAPSVVRVAALGKRAVVLTWRGVRDPGGLRGYRVRIGTRTLTVKTPKVTLDRQKLQAPVSIAAVDAAGNIGPPLTIPISRLR